MLLYNNLEIIVILLGPPSTSYMKINTQCYDTQCGDDTQTGKAVVHIGGVRDVIRKCLFEAVHLTSLVGA